MSYSRPFITAPAMTRDEDDDEDERGPQPGAILISADHRPSQPFPGAAPLRQVQQSPILTTNQQNQPAYVVPGLFSPQAGLQSPFQATATQYQHPSQQQQQQQQQPPPPPAPQQQAPPEHAYYSSNPSPRSTHSTGYYPKEKADSMAAATATMQRPYPSIYHTPQSNSPASVTSPQSHDQGRAMFSAPSQLTQSMYAYPGYSSIGHVHQPVYGGHHASTQMNPQSMLSYPANSTGMQHHQLPSQPALQSSPQLRDDHSRHYSQPPQSQPQSQSQQQQQQQQSALLHQRHPASSTSTTHSLPLSQHSATPATSNAAPGPIPATTPLVVHQDHNGVQWIAFEYSRDRVKLEYTIRCDVESVEHSKLSQEFKSENCVYPRACVPKEQYKGNRLNYETECNQVGWALAELNPCLRGKRGLIQRAVDSWRNSNRDPRLRSRRVRRQAKMQSRSKVSAQANQPPGAAGAMPTGLPSASPLGPPGSRSGNNLPAAHLSQPQSQPQHHHHAHDLQSGGHDNLGGIGSAYGSSSIIHRPGSATQHLTSPTDLRQAHSFPGYQTYPTAPTNLGSSMAPPLHGSMHQYGRSTGSGAMLNSGAVTKDHVDTNLFGDVPEGKRRKFILVEDTQKNARVRVKVTLDQVEMSEIPNSYRKQNSVFPRAYSPERMQSAAQSTSNTRFAQEDVEEEDDGTPIAGRITVPCQLPDGEGEVEVSRVSRGKQSRERKINELGYRMAWGQSRVFSGRPIFLGRALDAYRNKQRTAVTVAEPDSTDYPHHLDTRPGKRAWTERIRDYEGVELPPVTMTD